MKNKVKELYLRHKERVLTGAIMFLGVIIVAIFHNFYLIWILLGLIFFGAVYEMSKLISLEDRTVLYLAGIAWLSTFIIHPSFLVGIIFLLFIASKIAFEGREDIREILPFVYPALPLLLLLDLYLEFKIFAVIWLLAVVIATDTAAYFVGRAVGKTKFSETSPNKTLEGVAGGVVFGTIFGSLVALSFYEFAIGIAISFFVSLFSVFGDLFESYLKRRAGVKDSGTLFPGHGGVLDRVDGYLFGVVILYTALKVI